MFEKGKVAGEKILEDKIKLKRQMADIEQKQSILTLKIFVLADVRFEKILTFIWRDKITGWTSFQLLKTWGNFHLPPMSSKS